MDTPLVIKTADPLIEVGVPFEVDARREIPLLGYKYLDSPEGEDVLKKGFRLARYAVPIGIFAAAYDINFIHEPTKYYHSVYRFMHWMAPSVTLPFVYPAVTGLAKEMRGKDDCFNSFVGGATVGAMYGGIRGNLITGLLAAGILGTVGAAIKEYKIERDAQGKKMFWFEREPEVWSRCKEHPFYHYERSFDPYQKNRTM